MSNTTITTTGIEIQEQKPKIDDIIPKIRQEGENLKLQIKKMSRTK